MAVTIKEIDHGWNDILNALKKLDNVATKVGLFGDLAERGATHEYGTRSGKIPARPFNRQAFDNNERQIQKQMKKEYVRLLNQRGKVNPRELISNVGEWYSGAVKKTITNGNFEPLKPVTILRKGSSKPLIDTGQMRMSITHKEVSA